MKNKINKKIFQVEFKQDVIKSVAEHYIEQIEPEKLDDRSVIDAINYAVEITIGRIMHEACPRISDSLKNTYPGYRLTVELLEEELENPLDIQDTEKGLVINTKIKKKIDF